MSDKKKIVVKQIRGMSGRDLRTRRTLEAIGLGGIGKERVHNINPALSGMIKKVRHLVEVREA